MCPFIESCVRCLSISTEQDPYTTDIGRDGPPRVIISYLQTLELHQSIQIKKEDKLNIPIQLFL